MVCGSKMRVEIRPRVYKPRHSAHSSYSTQVVRRHQSIRLQSFEGISSSLSHSLEDIRAFDSNRSKAPDQSHSEPQRVSQLD